MMARARLVGRGRVRGRLYDAGAFPAAIAQSSGRGFIHGEVWMLPVRATRLLRALDRYEGCEAGALPPQPYRRTVALVLHELGWELTAWVYVWNRSTRALKPIRSGIWQPPADTTCALAQSGRGPLTAASLLTDEAA
jgi:gamma-glutamylcyclotransferase (GGCT)/AIG2-like uncharacterized protein YtfP